MHRLRSISTTVSRPGSQTDASWANMKSDLSQCLKKFQCNPSFSSKHVVVPPSPDIYPSLQHGCTRMSSLSSPQVVCSGSPGRQRWQEIIPDSHQWKSMVVAGSKRQYLSVMHARSHVLGYLILWRGRDIFSLIKSGGGSLEQDPAVVPTG